MKRLAQYTEQKADVVAKMRGILDAADASADGSLTPEQTTEYAALEARSASLSASIERENKLAAEEKLAPAVTRMALGENPIVGGGTPNEAKKPWANLGSWLQAVKTAHSGNGIHPALHAAATGHGEAIGPDGGYAVPVEFASGIEKEMWDTGALLSRVSERPVAGNAVTFTAINETSRADGSRRGSIASYWVDEGEAPTASQVKLARIDMKLRKVAVLGYTTEELDQDAPALAAELNEAFREELIFAVENTIFRGAGNTQPLGFMNAPCLVTVNKATGQAASTINTTNLSAMWARLPARSKANAVWLINVDCEPQLDELAIAVGTAGIEPRFVSYGPEGILRIKGRPVIPVEYSETLGTAGDITLVDLSRYRVIRKASGVEMSSSIHVRFVNGENTFRGIYRVDGQPIPRAAITPFKGSATLSPFVALQTRS